MRFRTACACLGLGFFGMAIPPLYAADIHVSPDGSGDGRYHPRPPSLPPLATIHIVLADGTYTGEGNRDFVLGTRTCRVRSASGDAHACIIDLQMHRGFVQLNPNRLYLQDITLTNGNNTEGGGAVHIDSGALTASGCRFIANGGGGQYGGAIYSHAYSA